MSFSKQKLGQIGEDLTEKLYLNHGYEFLARNYRGRGFELDLIFSKDSDLIIVEVKLRRNREGLLIRELVPPRKKRALERGALHFLSNTDTEFNTIRFELVVVGENGNSRNISMRFPHVKKYLL